MEPLDCYHEGGFHPIIIGDILNERYRIVRKLGSGSSATFWLVEDVPLKRYASLKVLSHDWAPTSYEIDVARYLMFLQDQPNPHPGADYVVKIFDVFVAHGPNGAHPCIVTELLGPNLLENTEWVDIREYWTRLSPEVSKKVVAQLSLGVGYLHNCGVIHGDLNLANLLCFSPDIQNMSLRKLRYIYGKSESSKVTYTGDYPPATVSKHLPKEMYSDPSNTSFLKRCVSSPDKVHIKICDFSESYIFKGPAYAPDRPFYGRMPYFFKAPEIIFHDVSVPSPSIDIWYLAIVMHMMICLKMPLFGYADENLVRQMVLTLGKLPDKWWNQWSDRAKYFDENGNLLEDSELKFKQYVTSLNIIADLYSEEEAADFESIIRRMVRYNPEDRITADEVYRLLPAQWKERRNTASSLAKGSVSSLVNYIQNLHMSIKSCFFYLKTL